MPTFTSFLRALPLSLVLASPALAQQTPPAADNGPIRNGRQQQPSRDATADRLRQQGVGVPGQEQDRELKDLNDLSRQLLPPGSAVPAPEVERPPATRR
ncbi:hypothetical protein [Roseomonas haemaphysalidis]|uniref:Uncharacterized protein n=1 Tax=Roseomonas haemaphysalidis TaxID=2768162 RepID=A0ABS3KKN5_9PROT|nr:hypothetical protein [Roseomonas haemaphysalidis]MBO1078028.1 hypothetical protein [Roseomonas haemaphysalidis]